MKEYFCVTSTFCDNGEVTAVITDNKEAEEKPENTSKSVEGKDIYNYWFESEDEANKYIEDCENA